MSEERRSAAEIDKYRLDEELEEQPRLYDKYAEKLADAKLSLDQLKNELEVAEAEADLKIRRFPEKYGIDKVSESAIKSAIVLDRQVRELKKNISEAKYKVDLLGGRVTALDHRKKSLEKLVDLYLGQYYSMPRMPRQKGTEQKAAFDKRAK